MLANLVFLVLGSLTLIIALGWYSGLLKPGRFWGHSPASLLFMGIALLAYSLHDIYEDQMPTLAADAVFYLALISALISVLTGVWFERKAYAKRKRDQMLSDAEILRDRFAQGDISEEELGEKLQALRNSHEEAGG